MSVSNEQRRKANTLSTPVVGKRTQVPTKRNRVRVDATVKVRAYPLLADALDGALEAGVRKLFKYAPDGKVDEDYLIAHLETISNYLTNALCEVLDFGDD